MANIELTPEELKVLEETLARSISDLAMEVGHTDSHDFKETLKQRKALLEQMAAKVCDAVVPA